jgi:hypothetical protein
MFPIAWFTDTVLDFQVCTLIHLFFQPRLTCIQNRVGSKFGGGGVAGASESNVDRRERLRKLALETIDLAKVRLP